MSTPQQQRERRERLAREAGREVRAYSPRVKCKTDAERREWKLEQKRRYRAEAAEKAGREFRPYGTKVKFDAHVKQWRKSTNRKRAMERDEHHDQHVRRYLKALSDREKYRLRYQRDPAAERIRSANAKRALPDRYVLRSLPWVHDIADDRLKTEVTQLKREQMMLRRLSRELKHAAAEPKEEIANEAV